MADNVARRAAPEELARKRAELARASRAGIWRFGRILLMLVAFVAAVLFFTRDRSETDILSFPTDGAGERDAEYWIYRDGRGRALLEFEIPRNPKMILNVAPATNGFTAVSWLGLQRDVLYRMEFSATEDASELELDLLASARRWRDSMCGDGARWIFYDAGGDGLGVRFFDGAFPWTLQTESGYGIPFVPIDYARTLDDGTLMRGIAFIFRCGAVRYVYSREIPESLWSRGHVRFERDPGMLVYSAYIDGYWESPGRAALPGGSRPVSDLLYVIRSNLLVDRAGFWRETHRLIDAVLVRSWKDDPRSKDIAFGCLRELRGLMKTYYWGKVNAYRNARQLKDGDKAAERAREDVKAIFADRSLWYFNKANGEEDWR